MIIQKNGENKIINNHNQQLIHQVKKSNHLIQKNLNFKKFK